MTCSNFKDYTMFIATFICFSFFQDPRSSDCSSHTTTTIFHDLESSLYVVNQRIYARMYIYSSLRTPLNIFASFLKTNVTHFHLVIFYRFYHPHCELKKSFFSKHEKKNIHVSENFKCDIYKSPLKLTTHKKARQSQSKYHEFVE